MATLAFGLLLPKFVITCNPSTGIEGLSYLQTSGGLFVAADTLTTHSLDKPVRVATHVRNHIYPGIFELFKKFLLEKNFNLAELGQLDWFLMDVIPLELSKYFVKEDGAGQE